MLEKYLLPVLLHFQENMGIESRNNKIKVVKAIHYLVDVGADAESVLYVNQVVKNVNFSTSHCYRLLLFNVTQD